MPGVSPSHLVGAHCKLEVVPPLPLAQRIALGLMHPTQVATPFHRPGWVYEEKVDGWRIAAVRFKDSVRLISRNKVQHTERFPELVNALMGLGAEGFILDGEVAVYDQALVSRFEWLRARPKDEPATLPVYMVFDVLVLGGRDLRGEPLKKRRRTLEKLISGHEMILPTRRLASDGLKAWEEAVERGYEGIVAKDPESPYVPGRTLKWLKVKQKEYRKDARGFYR
jgi:bifunctional non-homologous end joining protein LigD